MGSESKIVQFVELKEKKQAEMRREYERVLFGRILGCYTVIEKLGLKAVEIVDISQSGLSFRLEAAQGAFEVNENIDFRFYFSQATYLPTKLQIKRRSEVQSEIGIRQWEYGCAFDRSLSTHAAIEKFVEFVNAYAVHAKQDKGEKQVYFL